MRNKQIKFLRKQGFTFKEIGRVLEITKQAVEQRYYRQIAMEIMEIDPKVHIEIMVDGKRKVLRYRY